MNENNLPGSWFGSQLTQGLDFPKESHLCSSLIHTQISCPSTLFSHHVPPHHYQEVNDVEIFVYLLSFDNPRNNTRELGKQHQGYRLMSFAKLSFEICSSLLSRIYLKLNEVNLNKYVK